MSFSINTKQFFLTYPQCPLSRNDLLLFLKSKLTNRYESSVICQEEHEPTEDDNNTGLHLHAYICLKASYHIRNNRFFDVTRDDIVYHPNIQSVKSKPAVIRYVCKSDLEFLQDNFDVASYLESIEKKQAYGFIQAANSIKNGATIKDIDKEQPQFVMNYKRKIEDYVELQFKFKSEKEYPPFCPLPEQEDPNRKRYARFVNHKMTLGHQKSLWVTGITRTGKSTMLLGDPTNPTVENLAKYFRIYRWITAEDKQSLDIIDCDAIVIDEFKGQIKIGELIQLLDQFDGFKVPIKGLSACTLRKRVPVFITAQNTVENTYRKVDQLSIDALKRRLCIVHLTEQYPVQFDEFDNEDPLSVDLSFRTDNLVSPSTSSSLGLDVTNLLLGDKEDVAENLDSYDDHSEESNEIHSRKKLKK